MLTGKGEYKKVKTSKGTTDP